MVPNGTTRGLVMTPHGSCLTYLGMHLIINIKNMDGLLGGNLNHVQDNLKLYNEGVAMASGALV